MNAELERRLLEACELVRQATGALTCAAWSEHFCVPPHLVDRAVPTYFVAAGPRAALLLQFEALPAWLPRVREPRAAALHWRFDADSPRGQFVLPSPRDEADRAPASVSSLAFHVEALIDAHLAAHPEEAPRFPVLDDAALARVFG